MAAVEEVTLQPPSEKIELTDDSRLIFVYNADSGLVNGLLDLWHKTVSPQTYACNLCAVTYGPLGMKREWRDFVAGLGRPVAFLHRDELEQRYGVRNVDLPAAYQVHHEQVSESLSAEELNSVNNVAGLQRLVTSRLAGESVTRSE